MELKDIQHLDSVTLQKGDALIVVDMQNDFMPGGALAVEEGDAFIDGVNRLMKVFKEHDLPIVLTQDWHTPDHNSYASQHPGKEPFDPHEEPGIGPVLWPDHCVQGTAGAEFHPDLDTRYAETIVRKGYRSEVDSYSGFLENDHKTETGLDGYLKGRDVKRVFVCGLAADYCTYFTAADGAEKGYEVYYLSDLTNPVGAPPDSVENAVQDMQNKSVRFVTSTNIRAAEFEETDVR